MKKTKILVRPTDLSQKNVGLYTDVGHTEQEENLGCLKLLIGTALDTNHGGKKASTPAVKQIVAFLFYLLIQTDL